MYPDRGDISAPVEPDVSITKNGQGSPPGKEAPLLRLRNGALQAGLNERLQRVVAARKVRLCDLGIDLAAYCVLTTSIAICLLCNCYICFSKTSEMMFSLGPLCNINLNNIDI